MINFGSDTRTNPSLTTDLGTSTALRSALDRASDPIPLARSAGVTAAYVATITGTESFDFLRGTSGDDRIFGLGGSDTITATSGNDSIDAGTGFDAVVYGLNTAITLRPAGVIDKGQFGQDTLRFVERIVGQAGFANSVDASSITSGSTAIEVNLGGRFINVGNIPGIGFRGFTIENFVNATGTSNNDTFTGSDGNNLLSGLGGDDFFNATRGNDRIEGGAGFDTIDYRPLNVAITINPTGVINKGSAGQDTLFQVDRIIGAVNQTNTIDALSTPGGASINVQLLNNLLQVRDIPGLGLRNFFAENFRNVNGTQNRDNLDGNNANNVLNGFGGNDGIFGRGGDDVLSGGAGTDFVVGGDGNDVINGTDAAARGRSEIDDLEGGSGNDRFIFGDRSGSFYKFNGVNDVVGVRDFSSGDVIQLGLGETYRTVSRSGGFDLFVVTGGANDLVARVNTTTAVSVPTSNFTIASGQRLGAFIGA
ncbi:calcium-binding protein [Leptolyngbya sp. NIES-2104]|uniref:calcium-binding protein n=1 Tax=Leptolyngbya sp. NIES-2104 TaxID=1552121 RepID=UPI0006EC5453|nr:calcium-binding protein [Leptolyngbya sp. NIES-2104]GAP99245.1 alkaline phosphatase [Leptolyngbya sp. NIES-2104]